MANNYRNPLGSVGIFEMALISTGAYLVVKSLFKEGKEIKTKVTLSSLPGQTFATKSKPDAWYSENAEKVYNLLHGPTSSASKQTAANIALSCVNATDWYALESAFGLREWWPYGLGSGNLIDFYIDDLGVNSTAFKTIEAHLSKMGVVPKRTNK